jgi:hypothetical protein
MSAQAKTPVSTGDYGRRAAERNEHPRTSEGRFGTLWDVLGRIPANGDKPKFRSPRRSDF